MAKYGISGKILGEDGIVGYFVTDENNREIPISVEKTFSMVSKGLISDWEVVSDQDNNKYLYSSDYKISDIPTRLKTKLKQVTVCSKGEQGSTEGTYKCTDENGRKVSVSTELLWNLAKQGNVTNARAERTEEGRVLFIDY